MSKRPLTAEEVAQAIEQLPVHRHELRTDLRDTLSLIKRGIPVYDNAPIWKQSQNVIFVSKVDVELGDGSEASL